MIQMRMNNYFNSMVMGSEVSSSQLCFSENSTCAEKNWQQNGVRPETWILKLKGELRPVSATEMIGGIENSYFARSRAETFRGLICRRVFASQ